MPRPRSALLSVDLIVEAALKLVDQTGDFSFPRIARELGVSQSSLYNRISGREHIVELLRAHLFASNPLPAIEDAPWDEALRLLIRGYRDCFAPHPKLVPLLVTQTVRAPEVIALYEDLARTLERSGLDAADVAPALSLIDYFALGAALEYTAPEEVWAPAPDQYPALSRAVAPNPSALERIERAFDFGMETLVAGIANQAKHKVN
jgi:AcrR family transcriptional regulator